MGFQLSPGVNVSEVDLTNVVPAVASTAGGFVGAFEWGPINERILIDSEKTLLARFGKPTDATATDFLTASSFLAYGNALWTVRTANSSAINAATTSAVLIENADDYDVKSASVDVTTNTWIAKYPSALGNSLKVVAVDAAGGNTAVFTDGTYAIDGTNVEINTLFQAAPGTSTYVDTRGGSDDEIHIAVIDEDGAFTGSKGSILEVFEGLSKASDAKTPTGVNNYYANVINSQSKYIWFGNHDALGTNWGNTAAGTTFDSLTDVTEYSLTNGVDGNTVTPAEKTTGYDLFTSPEDVDVSLLITGAADATLAGHVIDIAVARKDAMAFISPEYADVVNNAGNETTAVIEYKNSVGKDTSYAVMDSGWKLMYDKYADKYRWIPLNADTAGLVVRTTSTRDAWFSPAGFNRGGILNSVRLAYNPKQADRDQLYKNGINPVVTFPGSGTILYGDKTLQSKPSAFDRINVRRLFIVLEKAISTASKFLLFEFNDEFTRAQFRNLVEPFLREVQGRRGVTDFLVVCDDTNNTGDVIDRNEFVGDIFIKPNKSINFIQLNFVAVRSGVEFSEVVGSV